MHEMLKANLAKNERFKRISRTNKYEPSLDLLKAKQGQ